MTKLFYGAVITTVTTLCALSAFAQEESVDPRTDRVQYSIKPSQTDPTIKRFDESHVILFNRDVSEQAQLAVFLPGTNGKPSNAPLLLRTIADQGYRVIGLEYNDEPAVVAVCPRDPNPKCSQNFREKRVFGDNVTNVVDNTAAESIVSRLTNLLLYLDRQHPEEHWGSYLAEGAPDWSRIIVSGLSQGAGMAAFIAKKKSVARVVLFSSPWDFYGSGKKVAPWISEPSATPPERWHAEYHRRENTADLISQAYTALRIPKENILVFDLDLPPGMKIKSENKFHPTTIRNPGYVQQWRAMFGHSPPEARD